MTECCIAFVLFYYISPSNKGLFWRGKNFRLFVVLFKMKRRLQTRLLTGPFFFYKVSGANVFYYYCFELCTDGHVKKNQTNFKDTQKKEHADGADLSRLLSENLEPFVILDAWLLSDALFIPDTCVL